MKKDFHTSKDLGNIPVLGQNRLPCGCPMGEVSSYRKELARDIVTILSCKQCGGILDFNLVKKWRLLTFPNGIQIELNRHTFIMAIKEYFAQLKCVWKDADLSVERIKNEVSKMRNRDGKSGEK